MIRIIYALCISTMMYSCELPPRPHETGLVNGGNPEKFNTSQYVSPDEEYVMVTTAVNLPMYVRHDQAAFKKWGAKMGVQTSILGPSEWDVPSQIATLEQVITGKPAGLLINGTDPGLAQVINKAVAAGIPTIVYDSEIKNSRRNCFIGSDWYEMGQLQGSRMGRLLKGKGKVACMGILGLENMEAGFRGFQDALKKFPGIEFIGKYDDKANVEIAARLTADLMSAHTDLAGIAGFDSNSGPGMALSIKERGKAGIIHLTTVDAEPEHLRLVKEGVIDYLVGQKRELFSYLGAQFLFDMRHKSMQLTANDAVAGVIPVPTTVITGSIEIDKSNIDAFLGNLSNTSKP